MKRLNFFTDTMVEANLLGNLIARICGLVDNRSLNGIEKYNGINKCFLSGKDADLKLLFYKNGKPFSKYVNKKELFILIRKYFSNLNKWVRLSDKSKKLMYSNNEPIDSDLPF